MYYFDIISIIQFLISDLPFVPYLTYVLVQYFLTNNLQNLQLNNKDEQIYREMHTIDW